RVNSAVDARVEWSGIGLTFFRDFPNLTIGLDDLTVVGIDRFEGDTLVTMESFRVVLDAGSLVRALLGSSPVVVRSVSLERPVVALVVLEDGTGNWEITRARPAAPPPDSGGRGVNVELRSLELSDGRVVYRNERTGVFALLEGVRHELSGNFSRDSLGVRTRTHADRTTLRFAGTPWLSGVVLDFEADIDADLADRRFAFSDNLLRLNDLALRFDGVVARADRTFDVDLSFATTDSDFRSILSLVPAIYSRDFASLETDGTFSLEGRVHGSYGPNTIPAFALQIAVAGGMFRYPDLPLPARAIALDLAVENAGGVVDSTVIDLRSFHAEIGGEPVDASFTLRTPVSDPSIQARLEGTLDLAELARTIKLQGVQDLAGIVSADASVSARRSDVEARRYDRIGAEGTITARGVALAGEALRQPLEIEEATLAFSPGRAELRSFQATIGSSDLQGTGWIENLTGFVLWDQPLRGHATLSSRRFVLDEWRSKDPSLEVIPVPPMLELTLDGAVRQLTYGGLTMSNARGRVRVRNQRLTLDGFSLEMLGGRVGVSGHYETVDPSHPVFAIDLLIDSLDVRNTAESLVTVHTFAPVARYASGTFSGDLDVRGAFGSDMMPEFNGLDATGSLLT
ncbi:MAG: AsmA family protein, partial [Longimicrobiales bacterium]